MVSKKSQPFENRTKLSGFQMVDHLKSDLQKVCILMIPDFEGFDFGSSLYSDNESRHLSSK